MPLADSTTLEAAPSDSAAQTLTWETDVPIATHPAMLGNFIKVFGITGLIMAGLLSFLLAMNGDAKAIPQILELTAAIVGGLFVLSLLISLVIFGNRMHMRFKVDTAGAAAEVADKRAKLSNRTAMVLGLVTMKPGVAGAGLLAEASAHQSIAWSAVAKARYNPLWRTIALSNGWRTVMTLFCTRENFETVAAQVRAHVARQPVRRHVNPLPRLLLHTVLIVLACVPLFHLPSLEEDGMLPALLTMCFALASLWLIPVLSWAVYAGLGWLALMEVAALNETHASMFGGTYSGLELLDDGDWATFAMAAVGVGYLLWLTIGLMRGRIRSVSSATRLKMRGSPRA